MPLILLKPKKIFKLLKPRKDLVSPRPCFEDKDFLQGNIPKHVCLYLQLTNF